MDTKDSSISEMIVKDSGILEIGTKDSGISEIGTKDSGISEIGTKDSGISEIGTKDSGISKGSSLSKLLEDESCRYTVADAGRRSLELLQRNEEEERIRSEEMTITQNLFEEKGKERERHSNVADLNRRLYD
ncbi:uncharacterized protein LOC124455624 isoform X2 [Xenia sp. Carnegie-2017]|uniref:uncharacterized protein LOC124455624 isoform X2 n=1 Tax=Xenia sp. Carnegie-2017 TaxID=2897299 RepID=UPI001F03571F|nr:uncharacterized protein LOC124455624 isoform X2 [Xenia sp. Carnegie-2017]